MSNSHVSAKKPGPISLGNKIIRFKLPHLSRRFTVHEDLICSSSLLFSSRLQKHRKPHLPTDDCPVCVSPLDATTTDITFCVKCGQNVHETCIEAWKRQQGKRGLELGIGVSMATCPMCRAAWKNEPLLKYLSVEGKGEAGSVQGYLEWLYSGRGVVHVQGVEDGGESLELLQFWEVADTLQDDMFRRAVIQRFLSHTHKLEMSIEGVTWAFEERRGSDAMRTFLLEAFMLDIRPGWFTREAANWPDVFVHALADMAMCSYATRHTREHLKRKYLGGVHDAEENEGQVESEATATESDDDDEVRIVRKPHVLLRGQNVTAAVDFDAEVTVNRYRMMHNPSREGDGDGSVGGRRVRARVA